ncbi:hypothetical protein DIURU_003452 [Diutina rugosa]|uniref:amidase n=1 Tax=Diutina rugosa TaxID=5481 RepID=A0A642UKT2_DIURU|nr:uncharacterized protein DIURU_003452 [Diutina rugosa]KAA8901082.1 hypothetical protein DIURU_003452 [Diutina rugosa]
MSPSINTPEWKTVADAKRASVLAEIPEEWRLSNDVIEKYNDPTKHQSVMDVPKQYLTAEELEITEHDDSQQLLSKIHAGQYTSLQVYRAFAHRVAIAAQLLNCCTEIMFEFGEKTAKELDAYFQQHGKPKGPFHGLPISVKDCFNVKGYDSVVGMVCHVGNKDELVQSAWVDLLLDQGAIIYVKSNVPMSMMSSDSENNVNGKTLNPLGTDWSSGGSSGGEGAIVAFKGAMIGVGTDIAGSIRFPAANQELFGFKPSSDRLPYKNQKAGGNPNFMGFKPVAGPLARSANDIEFFMKTVLDAKPWVYDPVVLPFGYQKVEVPEKLNIGVILKEEGDSKDLAVDQDVQDMVQSAANKLQAAGHNVKTATNHPSFAGKWDFGTEFFEIKVKGVITALDKIKASGEPIIPSLGYMNLDPPFTPIEEIVRLKKELVILYSQWQDYFQEQQIDMLLMPLTRQKKWKHDEFLHQESPYSITWNEVDFAAAVVPHDGGCVQLVCPRLMEEKLVSMIKQVDAAIN